MISLAELNESASKWGLPLTTVERDYVLGWVLWAIGNDDDTGTQWVFKGGTCIKKCFMATERFSEDLDFSLLNHNPLNLTSLKNTLNTLLSNAQSESGIDFSVREPFIKIRPDNASAEIRIYFRSLTGMTHAPLSIKLDLTINEPVIVAPEIRKIRHDYSDKLPSFNKVLCYSFSELFAEKIRAMGERARPRDLYDIISLFHQNYKVDKKEVRNILAKKCEYKNIPFVTYKTISESPFLDELESEWKNMLAHQLKTLPSYEDFWKDLPAFFRWLDI